MLLLATLTRLFGASALLLGSWLIFLLGCGPEAIDDRLPKPERFTVNERRADANFLSFAISTPTPKCIEGECPESVLAVYAQASTGRISGSPDYMHQVKLCTGNLIDEQTVLTNLHCVTELSGAVIDDCNSRLAVKTQSGESIACQEIVFDHEAAGLQQEFGGLIRDYALIRLDAPVSEPAVQYPSIATTHLESGEWYSAYAVDFDLQRSEVVITDKECRFVSNSHVRPFEYVEQKTFAVFGDCDVQPGNSGSLVLDRSGRGVGLLFFEFDMPALAQAYVDWFAKQSLDLNNAKDMSVERSALALSFSCLAKEDSDWQSWRQDPHCPAIQSRNESYEEYLNVVTRIKQRIDGRSGPVEVLWDHDTFQFTLP